MKWTVLTKTILGWTAFLISAFCPPAGFCEELTAMEIVRRCDDLLRGTESYTELTMTIERPEWNRSLTMEGWTQGTSNSFIRILSPKKEKGVTFLKRRREAWQYVPSIDRTIKIPPSMMLQSWMGSDFTNDDVVRADRMVVDYTHEITGEPTENGIAYWIVASTPKPDAPVIWGKVVFKIRKANFVADMVDYFDEDGQLIKHCETGNIREVEGTELATRLTMHDETRPGYSTTLSYSHITFSPEMDEDTFSLRNLKR
ncbi:MAG: outer membrane lipoprotein-sorting protein [Verrucomicrobia bacterium]|nr:outer membrane lipoprotein-sorting protein [Verrucomicrobiota bacterium]